MVWKNTKGGFIRLIHAKYVGTNIQHLNLVTVVKCIVALSVVRVKNPKKGRNVLFVVKSFMEGLIPKLAA